MRPPRVNWRTRCPRRGRRPTGRQGQEPAHEIGGYSSPSTSPRPGADRGRGQHGDGPGPPALVNSAGVGWAQRTIGKDGEFCLGTRPAPTKGADINLRRHVWTASGLRGHGDEPARADLHGRTRRTVNMTSVAAFGRVRSGKRAFLVQGRRGRPDLPVARDLPAGGSGSTPWLLAHRHPGSTARARPEAFGPPASRCCSLPARQARGTGVDGHRADHQLLHERRDRPRRRRHPMPTKQVETSRRMSAMPVMRRGPD